MKLKNKLVSFLWNIYLKNPKQAIAQQEYSDFQTFFQFCVCGNRGSFNDCCKLSWDDSFHIVDKGKFSWLKKKRGYMYIYSWFILLYIRDLTM